MRTKNRSPRVEEEKLRAILLPHHHPQCSQRQSPSRPVLGIVAAAQDLSYVQIGLQIDGSLPHSQRYILALKATSFSSPTCKGGS